MKEILESYSADVLRRVARSHLPKPSTNGRGQIARRKSFREWTGSFINKSKEELVELLLPYASESLIHSLDDAHQRVILSRMRRGARGAVSESRRRSHQRYEREVASPRRKAIRDYMRKHPELVEKVRQKHEL